MTINYTTTWNDRSLFSSFSITRNIQKSYQSQRYEPVRTTNSFTRSSVRPPHFPIILLPSSTARVLHGDKLTQHGTWLSLRKEVRTLNASFYNAKRRWAFLLKLYPSKLRRAKQVSNCKLCQPLHMSEHCHGSSSPRTHHTLLQTP